MTAPVTKGVPPTSSRHGRERERPRRDAPGGDHERTEGAQRASFGVELQPKGCKLVRRLHCTVDRACVGMSAPPARVKAEDAARLFEAERPRLRRLAFRLLGSLADAEDAVQEAWLRLMRAGANGEEAEEQAGDTGLVADLPAWLTTITARLALDALRRRRRVAEEPLRTSEDATAPFLGSALLLASPPTPEEQAMLADEVGAALMLVMGRLKPAERLAFVLHDAFGLSFDEVARILDRSPDAARQAASRARRRVRSEPLSPALRADREIVASFARAAREGDVAALIRVLDPDVTLHIDPARLPSGTATEVRGAKVVAGRAVMGALGRTGHLLLVDGRPALAVAPAGRLEIMMTFEVAQGRIARIDVLADPARLATLDLALPGADDEAVLARAAHGLITPPP